MPESNDPIVALSSAHSTDKVDGVRASGAPGYLWHQSGVNSHGDPFVQLILNDKIISQFTVAECREHARAMFEAAEAAETDSMLMDFFMRTIGLDHNRACHVLLDFRKMREERFKRGGTVTDKSQWVMPPQDQLSEDARESVEVSAI